MIGTKHQEARNTAKKPTSTCMDCMEKKWRNAQPLEKVEVCVVNIKPDTHIRTFWFKDPISFELDLDPKDESRKSARYAIPAYERPPERDYISIYIYIYNTK